VANYDDSFCSNYHLDNRIDKRINQLFNCRRSNSYYLRKTIEILGQSKLELRPGCPGFERCKIRGTSLREANMRYAEVGLSPRAVWFWGGLG